MLRASLGILIGCIWWVSAASADPADNEVLGTVEGKVYTYGELKVSSRKREDIARYNAADKLDGVLRSFAVSELRKIAQARATESLQPECTIEPSREQVNEFIVWWRDRAIEIRNGNVSSGRPQSRGLENISSSNPDVADAARNKLRTWLTNRCVYRAYGGGRVRQDLGVYRFVGAGETVRSASSSLATFPYPIVISDGTPLNAYIALMEKAEANGILSYATPEIEEIFYRYYRNQNFRFFAPEAEEAAIVTEYWLHPLVPFVPDQ